MCSFTRMGVGILVSAIYLGNDDILDEWLHYIVIVGVVKGTCTYKYVESQIIYSIKHLNNLIYHFEKCPLLSQKAADFLLFK